MQHMLGQCNCFTIYPGASHIIGVGNPELPGILTALVALSVDASGACVALTSSAEDSARGFTNHKEDRAMD